MCCVESYPRCGAGMVEVSCRCGAGVVQVRADVYVEVYAGGKNDERE